MAVEKLSISVPADVAALVREQAQAAGVPVSAWLAAAAVEKAENDRSAAGAKAAADELLALTVGANGPVTDDEQDWVSDVLHAAGLTTRAAG
jgi:hypothetical protein